MQWEILWTEKSDGLQSMGSHSLVTNQQGLQLEI